MPETPVVYDDVEVLEHDDLGFTCRLGAARVFIGKYVPLDGTTVQRRGDRGRLTLPRWFVEQQALPIKEPMTPSQVAEWVAVATLRVATAREQADKDPNDAAARAALARAQDELAAAMSLRERPRPFTAD